MYIPWLPECYMNQIELNYVIAIDNNFLCKISVNFAQSPQLFDNIYINNFITPKIILYLSQTIYSYSNNNKAYSVYSYILLIYIFIRPPSHHNEAATINLNYGENNNK